jgi:hypothetical protein
VILPARFEDFEGFRETTLAVFTEPGANAALRTVGNLLYTAALEYCQHWPVEPAGAFFHQARAVLADLRHLEGWLAHLDMERTASALTAEEERLSALCGTFVPALKSIGDALEFELGPPVDPRAVPPLEEVFRECDPLPWKDQQAAARNWVITAWLRGTGEGGGLPRLLRQVRELADRTGSFSFYHVVGLETVSLIREYASAFPTENRDLAEHLLAAADIPPDAVEHYTAALA